MNDYLDIAELNLLTALQETDELTDAEAASLVAAAARQEVGVAAAFSDKYVKHIVTYLVAMLPSFLEAQFSIPRNTSLEKKLIGTKALYEKLLEPCFNQLEDLEIPNADQVKDKLRFAKLPLSAKGFALLTRLIYTGRNKLKAEASLEAWKYLKRLFSIYANTEELDEENLAYIKSKALKIPHPLLSKFIKSLSDKTEVEEDAASIYEAAKKSEASITKKYFSSDKPSMDEMKKLQEKNPEKYKEWRKATAATRQAAKGLLMSEWSKRDLTIEPVSTAKKLLKELGIPCPIDSGFEGKVGMGTTKTMLFTYYTKYGKALDSVISSNVKMNPKYTKDDNTYYCTHMPFISKTGKPIKVYSADYRSSSSQKLHNTARSTLAVLEDVRSTFSKDIKPILNGKLTGEAGTKALCALVLRVIDETAGRIGNKGSERNETPTYGIHNLKLKHIKESKSGFIVKYIGKKGIPQEHKIQDATSVKAIKLLIKDRKKGQYIFSKTGDTAVSPSTVGEYLSTTGFPGSPHMFRKIWANKIFNEKAFEMLPAIQAAVRKLEALIEKLQTSKDAAKKQKLSAAKKELASLKTKVTAIWKEVVGEVAKKLGQTELNTSVRSYIDPMLSKKFWDMSGFPAPSVVQTVYDNMGSQNPNADD